MLLTRLCVVARSEVYHLRRLLWGARSSEQDCGYIEYPCYRPGCFLGNDTEAGRGEPGHFRYDGGAYSSQDPMQAQSDKGVCELTTAAASLLSHYRKKLLLPVPGVVGIFRWSLISVSQRQEAIGGCWRKGSPDIFSPATSNSSASSDRQSTACRAGVSAESSTGFKGGQKRGKPRRLLDGGIFAGTRTDSQCFFPLGLGRVWWHWVARAKQMQIRATAQSDRSAVSGCRGLCYGEGKRGR